MKKTIIFLVLGLILNLDAKPILSGFDHSSLVYSRRCNTTGNYKTGSWGYSQEAVNSDEVNERYYFGPENADSEQEATLSATGDINGDGMDDLIFVYEIGSDIGTYNKYNPITHNPTLDGRKDNSRVIIYDGYDGSKLCTFNGHANGYGYYLIETGDFDADGQDELALVRHASIDIEDPILGNDGIADGSCLEIYDFSFDETGTLSENRVWTQSPQEVLNLQPALESTDAIFEMKKGYFNNDTAMDLVVMYHYGNVNIHQQDLTKDNSLLVAYNGKNGATLWKKKCIGQNGDMISAGSGGYKILVGNFDNDPKNEIAHIRHASGDIDNDGIADGSYLRFIDDNGSYMSEYPNHPLVDSTDEIYACELGDFNNDGKDDIGIVQRYGQDYDNDNIKDQSILFTYDIYNHSRIIQNGIVNNGNSLRFSQLKVLDFNGDGDDDICVSVDIFLGTGVETKCFSSGSETLLWSRVNNGKLRKFESLDFNGNGRDELVSIVNPHNNDNSNIMFIDEFNTSGSPTLIYQSDAQPYYCTHLNILKNEITDIEFMNTSHPSFYTLYNIENNLESEVSRFFANIDLVDQNVEYYNDDDFNQLNYSSTAYGTETVPSGYSSLYLWRVNFLQEYNYLTATSRVRRLMYYMRNKNSSLNLNNNADLMRAKKIAKSIISHIYYLSAANHFHDHANVGMLFEFPAYIDCALLSKDNSAITTMMDPIINNRLNVMNGLVYDDGYFSESTFNYAFWFNYWELKIMDKIESFRIGNTNQNPVFPVAQLGNNERFELMKKMCEYFMYSINPIKLPNNITNAYKSSDLPLTGDTNGIIGDYIGKKINSSNYYSVLDMGIGQTINFGTGFINALKFAKDDGGYLPQDFEISKGFDDGRIFIARSNWKTSNGDYDNNARYCHFRVGNRQGKIVDNQHVDFSQGHMHADFLGLEISGYNKNLLIDVGGYNYNEVNNFINSTIYDQFLIDYSYLYKDTYNYFGTNQQVPPSYSLKQYLFRKYFVGTAAHNTIYIPGHEQVNFTENNQFSSIWPPNTEIENLPFQHTTTPKIDYAKGGYELEGISHDRALIYIKPNTNGLVVNDYWIVDDFVEGAVLNSNNDTIYQMWHLSPDQAIVSFTGGTQPSQKLEATNCTFVPLENQSYGSELLNGYAAFQDEYVHPTKILQVAKTFTNNNKEKITTLIFPHATNSNLNISYFTKKNVYVQGSNNIVSDYDAVNYRINFTLNNIHYEDQIFIGYSSGTYSYKVGVGREKTINAPGGTIQVNRFCGTSLIETITIDIPVSTTRTSRNEVIDLMKVSCTSYPNPFNPTTTISFNLPKNQKVSLDIYNIKGQKVKNIVNDNLLAGTNSFVWNGKNGSNNQVASGVYFYRLKTETQDIRKKILLLK